MTDTPLLPLLRNLVKRLVDFKAIHPEYIPKEGSALLTTNHLSRLDTPFLLSITDRTDLVAIVAKKYQQKPIFRWILEKIGTMVWMDRENTDFSAVREALAYLREGMIVGIAPEGTRSRDSMGLLEAKQGAALMAARAEVPIVPVGIVGSEDVSRKLLRFRRPTVTIRVGKPYTLPAFDRENRQAWLSKYTDEIMCRIAALLPPSYRGFYADHPRLKELLADNA
ncbi:1-acyl-sn-glycerol-3-phosphate acyltransferase [bacterium]|nr:1-acyl-sn-glycerol-3-phosphate acyltransferase [bacterium]